ncbi:MAG: sulfite exporter TauE/SafE family protein [Alphaproteobacteria bacterium]|nr:sulfite exporter TauE/SafE family protein [Alphaproteobacteria bacterium]
MFESLLSLLVGVQGMIREAVTADLKAFAETRDWANLAIVFPFGIAFGAVHALTPGHSKTLLASYVAGSEVKLLSSVRVAAILSTTHIFMSVLIALFALPIIERGMVGAGRAPVLEDLSRGLIAAIGAWMIYRALSRNAHMHLNGAVFGLTAGLIPCPLTLFTVTLAIARGIPEAGLAFALAMLIGVALTLSTFAAASALVRDGFSHFLERHGTSLQWTVRVFEFTAGAILLIFGLNELFL